MVEAAPLETVITPPFRFAPLWVTAAPDERLIAPAAVPVVSTPSSVRVPFAALRLTAPPAAAGPPRASIAPAIKVLVPNALTLIAPPVPPAPAPLVLMLPTLIVAPVTFNPANAVLLPMLAIVTLPDVAPLALMVRVRKVASLLTVLAPKVTPPAVAAPLAVVMLTFAASVVLPALVSVTLPPLVLMLAVSLVALAVTVRLPASLIVPRTSP